MSSTLCAHSPKFNSKLVDLAHLRNLPEPMALGRMHKPVHHATLVDAIRGEVDKRGYMIAREQLALAANSAALFGVMDLVPAEASAGVGMIPGVRGLSFGFRNAIDQSMGIKAVAGARVFVCDNLALSGSMFALSRKNTTGLDLGDAMALGFDKFLQHATALDISIARLEARILGDGEAKAVIFDIFSARVLPSRLFDDVDRFYFKATDETPMKDLSPVRGFGANVALGNLLGLRADAIDGEVVSVQ